MNLNLTNKTAVVGGSSQGLGEASAIALAAQGASIVLIARNQNKLEQVISRLNTQKGQQHSFVVADHSQPYQLKQKVEQHLTKNNITAEILINNSGGPPPGPISSMSSAQILTAINMHLIASHELALLLLPNMKSKNYGRIINITSTSIKEPIKDLGLSNTVRASVANWAKTMANELATFGITVNNVLPGTIATTRIDQILEARANKNNSNIETELNLMKNAIPMKRIGEVQDIGSAVAFLASPAANYITGINLPVDGGRTKGL